MHRLLLTISIGVACALSSSLANDWPPNADATNTTTRTNDGRSIERFTHGPREAWGYPADENWSTPPDQETGVKQQNHACFYVVAPKPPRENAPLCVVLHSANRTACDYLGFACLGRQIENREDPATVMTNSPDDFYSLYLSSTNAEWWGWGQLRKLKEQHNVVPPAECRVLDTIEWVAARHHIDRNRIYLCGVSMGGCGTLGLGMPHGDIFAAIRPDVPAGTEFAAVRTGGFAFAGLPDPPVIVDFSSPKDNWSKTQPALVEAAQFARLPLVLSWGPFGHVTFSSLIAKYPICDVALAFPWLEVRKNEAYPVFTHASCDQRSPWLNAPSEFDSEGQMNAWFRWNHEHDTAAEFAMQLWIEHPTVKTPPAMPDTATADVTLRRLKKFKVQQGKSYAWQVTHDANVIASGKIKPDATNLLTIPAVTLATKRALLVLKTEGH